MYKRVVSEIGSEFWPAQKAGDVRYLLTGRTALEFIIRDILAENDIKSVLMPSYCCHTMIMPFVLHGIDVRFYDVFYDGELCVDLPVPRDKEIFFLIHYFGYEKLEGLENIRKNWETIIEDQTHTWLTNKKSEADYTFASYKKWFEVSGIAKATKRSGRFIDIPLSEYHAFNDLREKAFALKKQYIENGKGEKNEFLNLFNQAEELIETDYCSYRPSADAVEQMLLLDIEELAATRRRNAAILIDGLKEIYGIKVIWELGVKDVPLCVPILVPNGRSELRTYLINNDIFLPVHWPLSDYHKGITDRARMMYNQELSVVCDQRYRSEDMMRIIDTISDYYRSFYS